MSIEASIAEVYPIQQQYRQLGRDSVMLDHSHVIFGGTQRFGEALNSSTFAKKSSVLARKRPGPMGSTGQNRSEFTP